MRKHTILLTCAFALVLAAFAAQDYLVQVSKVLPVVVDTTNTTASFDLGPVSTRAPRPFYFQAAVPALAAHTNPAVQWSFQMQDSADDSTFSLVTPLVEGLVTGVATTGSAATNFYMPVPPGCRRYVRFQQICPTGGGTNATKTNIYSVVIP